MLLFKFDFIQAGFTVTFIKWRALYKNGLSVDFWATLHKTSKLSTFMQWSNESYYVANTLFL